MVLIFNTLVAGYHTSWYAFFVAPFRELMSKASFRAVVGGVGFSLLYTGTGLGGAIIWSVFALVHFPVLLELLFVPLNTYILLFITSLSIVTIIRSCWFPETYRYVSFFNVDLLWIIQNVRLLIRKILEYAPFLRHSQLLVLVNIDDHHTCVCGEVVSTCFPLPPPIWSIVTGYMKVPRIRLLNTRGKITKIKDILENIQHTEFIFHSESSLKL